MFQNIASLQLHAAQLAKDPGFNNSDVILLSECRTNPLHRSIMHDTLFGPVYTLKYMSGSINFGSAHGQVCYVRKSREKLFECIAHNCDDQQKYFYRSNDCCELSLFKYKMHPCQSDEDALYILHISKHPKLSTKEFAKQLVRFICEKFNIDKPIDPGTK